MRKQVLASALFGQLFLLAGLSSAQTAPAPAPEAPAATAAPAAPAAATTTPAAPAAAGTTPAAPAEAQKEIPPAARHPTYADVMKPKDPNAKPYDKIKLTDNNGKEFDLTKFRGKLVLVNFFFSHCPNICPPQTAGLVKTWEKLGKKEQDSIAFVSVSIDPKNDSPKKLTEYKKQYNIKTKNWVFATGSQENITELGNHFGSLGGGKDPMEHRGRIYLVDPKGMYLLSFQSAPVVDSDRISKELAGAVQAFIKKSH